MPPKVKATTTDINKSDFTNMIKSHTNSFLRLFIITALTLCALQTWGRPALRKPCDVIQPDGSVLTIQLQGDEFKHFTTTTDGYTVVKATDGFYYYAYLQDGRLSPSGVKASNPSNRTLAETSFLATQKKMLSPAMTECQKALKESAARLYTSDIQSPHRAKGLGPGRVDYDSFKGLILLVEFSDRQFLRTDANDFYKKMTSEKDFKGYYDASGTKYTNCDGSVRDYFRDNSMGIFDPTFDVVGPVTINYKAKSAKGNDNIYALIKAALNTVNGDVNYADYDLNKDGTVDMVYFIFAGYGSYVTGNDSNYVWPHASDLSWYSAYSGLRYDGMKFGRYACSVEIQDLESQAASHQILDGIGTMCHEFSHVLGLADHYDTDYEDSGGDAIHPGTWDVMAGGADMNDGYTPVGYNSYERYSLGFASAQPLDVEGQYTLEPFNTSNQFYLLKTGATREKFYIENRQKEGWDRFLPGHGMLVWRVDSSNTNVWTRNTVNNNPSHLYFDLVRAYPDKASIIGSAYDPFPGRRNVIDLTKDTEPALLTWGGKEAVLDLYDISETSEGIITFNAGKDLYKSEYEDFESLETTDADREGMKGVFCNWDLSKATVVNAEDEGYGSGKRVVKVLRSGTLTSSEITTDVRSLKFKVWSGNAQARVTLRAYVDGAWKQVAMNDGSSQVTLSKNSEATLSYTNPFAAGTKFQIQITGTTNSMVAYVDDISISFTKTSDGIVNVESSTPTSFDGQRYSITGQKVNGNYHGVVICNGKKYVNK